MPVLGKEKLGKKVRLVKVIFFGDILMTGNLSFTVTQEMAGPDSEVNRALQARSRL